MRPMRPDFPPPAETLADASERLGAVERVLEATSRDLESLARVVASGGVVTARASGEEGEGRDTNKDERHYCPKCFRSLGFYDVRENEIRMKRGSWVVYITLGIGGNMVVICWGCAAKIPVTYELPRSPEARLSTLAEALAWAVGGLINSTDPHVLGPVLDKVSEAIRSAQR